MAEPVTMETTRMLRRQDSPLPALAGPAIKLLFGQIEQRDEQAAELKRRACFAHALCYELSKKHPEVPELGDDGALHCAIHAILAVDTSSPETPALTGALPGEGVPAPWLAPPVPSRFQIREQVRACGVKGTVDAVTFTVLDGQGKVLYDIAHSGGVLSRVLSDQVQPVTPSRTCAPFLPWSNPMAKRNPILIGQAEVIDLVQPQVRRMLEVEGLYIGTDTEAPEFEVPLVVMQGKVYSMKVDQKLAPERFKDTLQLAGPFRGVDAGRDTPAAEAACKHCAGRGWYHIGGGSTPVETVECRHCASTQHGPAHG